MAQINNGNPPEFVVTDYEYDDLGRSLLEISADTNDTHLIYDPAGNLERKVDANGVIVSYTYDQLNRPTTMAFPNDSANNTSDLFLTYDTASHGLGKLANMVEKDNGGAVTGSTSYGYDSRGRWVGLTSTINGRSFTVGRIHTTAGRLAEMIYPSGRTVTFGHNSLGQVSDVTATVGGQNVALAANLAYYPFGPMGGLATGNGGNIVNQTGECGCGVVVSNGGTVNERIYSYDGNKNLTGLSMPQKPWKNEVYTYDALQHLESATTPAGSFVYSYDFLGNRLTANSDGKVETYAQIISSNVLDKITSTAGTTQYYYDNYGNTTGIGARIFAYDKRNRLLQVTEGATTLGSYQYNGFNQRVSKTAGGAATLFVHDFDGNIIAEAQSDGTIKSEFLYWGSSRLARVDKDGASERLYYFLNDRLGTPVAMTNTSNAAVWEAVYEPFGKAEVNGNSAVVNNFRFPGQYYDAETGLHYNWNRYYNPATGRYIMPDPIGLAGGINPFVMVGGNPVNRIDPSGLRDILAIVWDRKVLESSVGHIALTETNGETITSSFPAPHGTHGINTTKSLLDTIIAEGRAPSAVFKIFVPDDKAFDKAAAIERGKGSWDWQPNKDETNCTVAAYRSLREGGVTLSSPWIKPWSPNDFLDEMNRLTVKARSGVSILTSHPFLGK